MKQIFSLLLILILFSSFFTLPCVAVSAQSAVVIDANSGRVLYAHNADQQMGMASTTKIMTAITALEKSDINSIVTVSPNAYGVEGSSMYLALGEKLTLENILFGLMLVSGNDAATAIAEHVAGSTEKFSVLMNDLAQEIGATNSNFTNPHGLSDPNHYTTANDLAKITAYAMKNPKFREIVSTKKKNIPWKDHDYDRHMVNHNKFLSMYDGCIGVKTGFTKATGRCLVTAVEQKGMTLICVTLNAPDDWNDHKMLYDRTISEFEAYQAAQVGEILSSAKIQGGTKNSVNLTVDKDIFLTVRESEKYKIKVNVIPFEDLKAPVAQGDVLGKIIYEADGNQCGEFNLVAAEDIKLKTVFTPSETQGFAYYIKKIFASWLTCFE